jgi:hypothetical protein
MRLLIHGALLLVAWAASAAHEVDGYPRSSLRLGVPALGYRQVFSEQIERSGSLRLCVSALETREISEES